jgi:PASTA domain
VKSLAVLALSLVVVPVAFAQQNDAVFKQTQGDDGLVHMEVTASYAFPGLPPRTANSGAGTVRVTLPGANFKLESVDPGYTCVQTDPAAITCSAQDAGPAFPTSMTMRLVSAGCWAPDAGQAGSADVWAAPTDPGSAPDVTLPIQPGECAADAGGQPVQDTKETCKVPNLKGDTVAEATRELKGAVCTRGKVKLAFSPKVKKGRVISQSQRPGKTLKAGAKVNLVVSRGKRH